MLFRILAAILSLGLLGSCASYSGSQAPTSTSPAKKGQVAEPIYMPDLPVNTAPFVDFKASWKQRLDQPYVYVEYLGSYTETGTHLPALHREVAAQGLEPSGPPFCLFFDDPTFVPVHQLRSRACIPIAGPRSPRSPLAYDILPSTTVAYGFVGGPYPDAPRAYPGVYAFMDLMRWVENGPIREIYLIPPTADVHPTELICEVQIPASPQTN